MEFVFIAAAVVVILVIIRLIHNTVRAAATPSSSSFGLVSDHGQLGQHGIDLLPERLSQQSIGFIQHQLLLLSFGYYLFAAATV